MANATADLTDNKSTNISDADNVTAATAIDSDGGNVSLNPVDSSPFEKGEKVLVRYNNVFYEAKVEEVEYEENEWRFFIHYIGWNKSWDGWVGIDRLKKLTNENVQKQQTLKQNNGGEKRKLASQGEPKGKKRKREEDKSNAVPLEARVTYEIPSPLKKQLVDDYEYIRMGKLVKLPNSPNVDDILNMYVEYRAKENGTILTGSVTEIMKGLRTYFDKALPGMLLYGSERQQFEELTRGEVKPSLMYGAEHLLRLFVKLPEILSHAVKEEQALKDLQEILQDFLMFLQKNQTRFFLTAYQKPQGFDTSTEEGRPEDV